MLQHDTKRMLSGYEIATTASQSRKDKAGAPNRPLVL